MRKPPYRTLAGLLTLGAFMLIALAICRDSAQGQALLTPVIGGLGSLGLWLAGKSAVEHATNKGAP